MENIDIIRQRYQDTVKEHKNASGADARYYVGKLVGMADAVSDILNISWIEADMLLRKAQ
jgi:hypothetical protein